MAGELQAIEELLRAKIGLDPTSVGPQFVLRAARLRMRDLKLNDLAAYELQVRQSATELEELIEEVIVAESWFFRDERPFEWLRDHVREKWIGAPECPALRILSLPCASGEEPYSIAIVLREAGLPSRKYHIDGVDISARRLANARRGVYSKNAFRGPDAPYKARYFRQHPEGYQIVPELRTTVQFIQGSILDSRLLEGFPPYNVVFCRNLLIYLAPSAREALLERINKLLAPDGVLLIGHADRLDSTRVGSGFVATGELGCFAYQRITHDQPFAVPALLSLESPGPTLILLAPAASHVIEATCPHKLTAGGLQPVGPMTAETLNPSKPEHSLLLSQASELANQRRFVEALALCERCLREKGLSASTYCLMGMICQGADDHGRAEDCFRKAVYLDPNHEEALLALALLAEHRGDRNAAIGFRRRAERTATLSGKRVN
jgi:chemotaxis protein methyltransferase WspC